MPGGEIEEGETAEQAFLRELQEETNLQPNYYEYLGKSHSPAGIYHELFLVKLSNKELSKIKLGNEGQELKFHSFENLLKISITAGMEYYLKKYGSYLKKILENNNLKIDSSKLGLIKL